MAVTLKGGGVGGKGLAIKGEKNSTAKVPNNRACIGSDYLTLKNNFYTCFHFKTSRFFKKKSPLIGMFIFHFSSYRVSAVRDFFPGDIFEF